MNFTDKSLKSLVRMKIGENSDIKFLGGNNIELEIFSLKILYNVNIA